MRERMGFKDSSAERRSNSPKGGSNLGGTVEFDRDDEDAKEPRVSRSKKSVKIVDKENQGDNDLPPRKTSAVRTSIGKPPPSRGRSRS